jgi:hypothetical protein
MMGETEEDGGCSVDFLSALHVEYFVTDDRYCH